jgi:D-3-phosphoglycerate dehydrogenase
LDTGYASYALEERILGEAGYRLALFEGGRHDLPGKLAFAREAVGVFIRWSEFDDAAFDALAALKCVVRYGVGYDNVHLDAATRHGVRVSNVQGYANEAVSDHALALILSCVRSLPLGARRLRENYAAPPRAYLPELKDMTLGIVGLGRIGGAVCVKARPLFHRTLACDPYICHERFQRFGAEEASFDVILCESDVVSVHCSLTEETRRMFNRAALARMRPTAILVNTARGPIVDEDALLEALNAGALCAAALDVFCDEPPRANRDDLLAHPQVTATGHYGWYSNASHVELQRRAAENMAAMLQGGIPEDCLNAQAFR